jgi:putative ABC transport system permease protein
MSLLSFYLAFALAIGICLSLLMLLPWWVVLAFLALLTAWMALTRTGQQTWSVAKVGIATIPQRLGASAVVVVGIAGVVGVLVAILAMGAGFERTLKQTGSEDTVIVLQAGSRSEIGSSLDQETVALLTQASQVMRNSENQPIVSAEQLVTALFPKRSTGLEASVAVRGVGEHAWELWPRLRVIEGRKFKTGLRELLVGRDARDKFAGLNIGATVTFDAQSWIVVGTFDTADAHNSEIWGDSQALGSAYQRGGMVNSLALKLTDPHAFDALKAEVRSDPRLKVEVQSTRQYYNQQSETFVRMIRIVGATIGAIMALGATFGALNATYMAVTGRSREIATLRAIGFRQVPVVVSVLLETMLLAALGGAIGALVAWAIFDGFTASTAGDSGQIVFAFKVSPNLLWNGLKWALAIGFIGGLFPAVRAARMSIVAGLREI